MASITWSGSYSGTSAGSGGKTITLTSSSALPSGATITGVTYSLNVSASKSSNRYKWNLYWLIAQDSSGTIGASIGTSGSSTAAASATMSSASNTFTGSLTASNASVFQSTSIQCFAKANTSYNVTSYMNAVSITVTYEIPSFSWEGAITVTQVNNQVRLDWEMPVCSGGTGECTITIYVWGSAIVSGYPASNLTYTTTPPAYGSVVAYALFAVYNGQEIRRYVEFTASAPTLTWDQAAPVVTATEDGLTLTWGEATGQWGAAGTTVSYSVWESTSESGSYTSAGTTNQLTMTIEEPSGDRYYLIKATYSTAELSSAVTVYSAHKTVLRWNGSAWEECIVYCYDGSNWVECIPYEWDGENWNVLSGG